ncbi:MAG: hypothetical protein ABJB01_05260 [Rudaea sp.]
MKANFMRNASHNFKAQLHKRESRMNAPAFVQRTAVQAPYQIFRRALVALSLVIAGSFRSPPQRTLVGYSVDITLDADVGILIQLSAAYRSTHLPLVGHYLPGPKLSWPVGADYRTTNLLVTRKMRFS